VEEKLDLGAMTMDKFIALGGKIFNGKGTCTLCHNKMGRAPMLDQLGKNGPERLKDPRYHGKAKNLEEYIYESETNPSAYVVAGFGKSGTNDTESPMPVTTGGSIGLSEAEVRAVIAYLQDLNGVEVTVTIPAMPAAGAEAPKAEEAAPLKTAEEVIAKYGCGACHTVAGQTGEIGPNLTKVGARANKDYIRQSILDPDAVIVKGYPAGLMPQTFGEQMKAKEFDMLVNYLAGLK
jgi:mono/diheme cytochrome c family protein